MYRLFVIAALVGGASSPLCAKPHAPLQNGESARYVCADGRAIEVLYGGGDTVITIGDAVPQMTRIPDVPEERYAGDGWSWSVTGRRSGLLARAGGPPAVACRAG